MAYGLFVAQTPFAHHSVQQSLSTKHALPLS
jgi:hypothetical protein